MSERHILCPSSTCEEGAILLGITKNDGRITFLSHKIIVNEEFVQIARSGRSPEKRFRFSNMCVNSACKQWQDNRCGVIDKILEGLGPIKEPTELPKCSIREQCRWYEQHGGRACAMCPEVITDSRQEADYMGLDKPLDLNLQ